MSVPTLNLSPVVAIGTEAVTATTPGFDGLLASQLGLTSPSVVPSVVAPTAAADTATASEREPVRPLAPDAMDWARLIPGALVVPQPTVAHPQPRAMDGGTEPTRTSPLTQRARTMDLAPLSVSVAPPARGGVGTTSSEMAPHSFGLPPDSRRASPMAVPAAPPSVASLTANQATQQLTALAGGMLAAQVRLDAPGPQRSSTPVRRPDGGPRHVAAPGAPRRAEPTPTPTAAPERSEARDVAPDPLARDVVSALERSSEGTSPVSAGDMARVLSGSDDVVATRSVASLAPSRAETSVLHGAVLDAVARATADGREARVCVALGGEQGQVDVGVRQMTNDRGIAELRVTLQCTADATARTLASGAGELEQHLRDRGYSAPVIVVRDAEGRASSDGSQRDPRGERWDAAVADEAYVAAQARRHRDAAGSGYRRAP